MQAATLDCASGPRARVRSRARHVFTARPARLHCVRPQPRPQAKDGGLSDYFSPCFPPGLGLFLHPARAHMPKAWEHGFPLRQQLLGPGAAGG